MAVGVKRYGDMGRWAETFDKTSGKFPFRVAEFRPMNGSMMSFGVSVGVQYLGEGVSWTDVGVKGVRDAKVCSCE